MYSFHYDGRIREKIIQYKFEEKSYLYDFFAKCILKNEKICKMIKSYDIIIPIPIHKKRYNIRGYNQSTLIAKKMAEILKIEMMDDCLYKNVNTIEQSKLNKNKRKHNVKNVYSIKNSEKIKDKKIILFDDIYTTGSTANECARILKKAGVKDVVVLTIAKD